MTTTHYAVIQIATRAIYGVGATRQQAEDAAAREGAYECTCQDDDATCEHRYGIAEDYPGMATVPCTAAAAAYVEEHGGSPSHDLSVGRDGVCLMSEEE